MSVRTSQSVCTSNTVRTAAQSSKERSVEKSFILNGKNISSEKNLENGNTEFSFPSLLTENTEFDYDTNDLDEEMDDDYFSCQNKSSLEISLSQPGRYKYLFLFLLN